MGKFKNAVKLVGELADAWAVEEKKVNDLTDKLMDMTYGVDREQAKKIARALNNRACHLHIS